MHLPAARLTEPASRASGKAILPMFAQGRGAERSVNRRQTFRRCFHYVYNRAQLLQLISAAVCSQQHSA